MKTTTKKQLLVKLIEHYVQNGISIYEIVGKPLSYFDFEKIEKIINEIDKNENKNIE